MLAKVTIYPYNKSITFKQNIKKRYKRDNPTKEKRKEKMRKVLKMKDKEIQIVFINILNISTTKTSSLC